MFLREILKKSLWTGARPTLEQPLEVERTEMDMCGDLIERWPSQVIGIEKVERAFDPRIVQRRLRKRPGVASDCSL